MGEFLRGLSPIQMGPFTPQEIAPDDYLGHSELLAPLVEMCFFSAGASGTSNDDDDDELPPPAATDRESNQYYREMRRARKDAGKYRSQLRDAQGEVETLRSGQISDADKAALEAYRALGTPEAVRTLVEERGTFSTELSTLRRDEQLRDVASAAGFNFKVLRDRAGELVFETRDEKTQDEKTIKVVYVKGENGTATPLRQYAEQQWADYLPALIAGGQAQASQGAAIQYPSQPSGSAANAPKTYAQRALEEQHAAATAVKSPFDPS